MYKKVVTPTNTTEEYYLMDAFGKTLAIENMKVPTDKWEYFVVTNERDVRLKPSDNSVQFNYGEATFFLYDHLGNTRVSYSKLDSGLMVHSLTDYFPYGKILREYVSTRPRYLTTQHERDVETDLDYRGARYYDSEYGRFLSIDPLASKYPSISPYVYVADNPIMYIDPDGRNIVLTGDERKAALRELRAANPDLRIRMDRRGNLRASVRKGKTATDDEQKMLTAIKDNSVICTIVATNNKFASNGDPNLGNFMGNYTDENGVTHTRQEINPNALSKWDALSGNPGKTTNHEVTESYFGGKIAQKEGVKFVGSATMSDATDGVSVYYQAHNGKKYLGNGNFDNVSGATVQPAGYSRIMHDSNGIFVPNPADWTVPKNVSKIDYYNGIQNSNNPDPTQLFHTIKIP